MSATPKQTFDVYRNRTNPTLRLAVAPGAGLPGQFASKDWTLVEAPSVLHSHVSEDVKPKAIATSSWSRANGQMKKARRNITSPRDASRDRPIYRRSDARRPARIKMSKADLGEKLGVTFQQIQKYVKGRNRVSAARLFEICEALDISLASMFERQLKA
jgi:DNA-binding Xre family transcriptional regulator